MRDDKSVKRHKRFFRIMLPLVSPVIRYRFRFKCDDFTGIQGPYLLLANHNTDADPAFVAYAVKKHIYFVASEHITHKGLISKFVMRYISPVIHLKGREGSATVRNMMRVLRSGNNIALFPEGNRSFNGTTLDFNGVPARMAAKCDAGIVTMRIEGGYFTSPRWGKGFRKGRMYGHLVNFYSPDRIKEMTDEELSASIREDLYEDAYAAQEREPVLFKGRRIAEGLETTLFMCPDCRKIGTLTSKDNTVSCTCGFSAAMDGYGYLNAADGRKLTITGLDRAQLCELKKTVAEASNRDILFSDEVTLIRFGSDHTPEESMTGHLAACKSGFLFDETFVPAEQISGAAIYSQNVLVCHKGSEMIHYEIRGGDGFSALKYVYLYDILKEHI